MCIVHDEERSGRPSIITDDLVELVRECIVENCCFTVTELSRHFLQISCFFLHNIVMEHLLCRKLSTRWVPKQLTPEHKVKCMESALTFLQWYHDDGNEFLEKIIAGDEMWVAHITPETKQHQTFGITVDLSLQDKIQVDFIGAESDVHCVLGQVGHSSHQLPDLR